MAASPLLMPLLFGAPWIAGSVWFWLQRPRDGALPLSAAAEARSRR